MENDKPIGMKIAIIGRLFKKEVREECVKEGISITYSNVIMHLANHPDGLAQNVIAEKMHMAAPTISLTIRNMENDGLVSRRPDESDSRISIVSLTERGRELDKVVQSCFNRTEQSILDLLGDKDSKEINRLLDILVDKFTKEVS